MKMSALLTKLVATRQAGVTSLPRVLAFPVAAILTLAFVVAPVHAQQVVQPRAGSAGEWRLIGQTHADHAADHDSIIVKGPFDNFRKIKFKVTDAPLDMQHMVVTYDNGQPDKIDDPSEHSAGRGKPRDRSARYRQAQRPQDRLLVRHEGLPEGQGRRDRIRNEVNAATFKKRSPRNIGV